MARHKWIGCQLGGSPANAESYEWIRYCKVCGMEDTCEDPLPECPGDGGDEMAENMVRITKRHYDALMVGGNHLANFLIGKGTGEMPNDYETYNDALNAHDPDYADAWAAWRAIMDIAIYSELPTFRAVPRTPEPPCSE